MNGITYIYGLIDHATNSLFYVGHTSDLQQRYFGHRGKLAKHCKDTFSIEVLESGDHLTADDELFWISYMEYLGCELKNKAKSGGLTRPHKQNRVVVADVEQRLSAQNATFEELQQVTIMADHQLRRIKKGLPVSRNTADHVEIALKRGISKLLKMNEHKRMGIVYRWKEFGISF